MNKILYLVIAVVLIGGVAAYLFLINDSESTANQNMTLVNTSEATNRATTTNAVNGPTTYSLADIAPHDSISDCWMAINGGVYNVTNYINSHPSADILDGCGIDATSLFNARPAKDNTPHPAEAQSTLSQYKIGGLK